MGYFRTSLLLAALTALFLGLGWLLGGGFGVVIALIFAMGTNFYAWWNSDTLALSRHNAEMISGANNPDLFRLVGELADAAGLPHPKVAVISADAPNAFATGRNPDNATVAVTTGLLAILDRDELAGVIAHELAHIEQRDTLTMTIAATVGGAISMLAQFALFFGGGRDRGAFGIIGVILGAILAPIAAMLIQMMVSRGREYVADRRGAEISGAPLALASALQKLSARAGRIEMETAERAPASAHLFIVNPLSGARMDNLFSTHPNPENRIAALRALAETMPRRQPRETARRAGSVPLVRRRKGPWA
ncbi:zinc metalloprotease HtpX [Abyssibius alkaniclasticus]|uniref:zinc metalloprotease HtpX n=1 Tax=Abyssibius alkaniclasticus TaxID=2881234 RepID=UPI002364495D|nr:zinc metalloprotease HtpX [Abyssibius alkaniclasticus]UPH72023.1 zinc metalloprotease HtpX [Abyssibius alkaniclasticus]